MKAELDNGKWGEEETGNGVGQPVIQIRRQLPQMWKGGHRRVMCAKAISANILQSNIWWTFEFGANANSFNWFFFF
jgi:hypothetical protein